MAEEKKRETLSERLVRMASFESMFVKENLLLGLSVWLQSTGIMLVLNIVSSLTGVTALLGSLETFVFLALGFYLMYRAIAQEAWNRYKIPVLTSCWWSFYWRVLVFIVPVIFFLTMMLPESYLKMDQEQLLQNPEPIFYLQIAALVLSIIPSGLAASRAILVSYTRMGGLAVPRPENDSKNGSEKGENDKDQNR